MNLRTAIGMRIFGAVAVSVLTTAQMAAAQEPATAREDTFVFVSNAATIAPFGGQVDIIRGMGTVPGSVVTGKPYSADAVTESTQMLADGNRITQRNETRIFRDGQGRTRREQTLNGLGVWQTANEPMTTITIHDPVAGTSYMLDPRAQTARQMWPSRIAAASWHVGPEGETATVAPAPALPPSAGVAVHAQRVVIEAEGEAAPNVETFELPLPHPGAGVAAFPPMAAMSFTLGAPGEVTTDDLGEQILEGVLARGSRETRTIPAGAIGNERPIDIVMERWYSDALEADVLRRNIDPRFGETTYQLVNVVLGEPAANLFVVPESYELQSGEDARFEFKLARPEAGNAAAP